MENIFTLPSSGDQVEVRRLKVGEQNMLADRSQRDQTENMKRALAACVLTPGFPPDDWFIGDQVALMLHIRMLTYGPEFRFKVQCSDCMHTSYWTQDLSELSIQRFDPPVPFGEEKLVKGHLPYLDTDITLRMLKVRDQAKTRQARLAEPSRPVSASLRLMTQEVEGMKIVPAAWFDDLDCADLDYLMWLWQSNDCGVDTEIEVICPNCYASHDIELPVTDKGFFLPRAARGRTS